MNRAHRIGTGDDRPMVVKFSDQKNKAKVFAQLSNLKGKSIYVNDQLPEELSERRRRDRQILATNKKLPDGQRLKTLKMKKGRLHVGDKVYQPKIQPPKRSEILAMTSSELHDLKEMAMAKTQDITEQHSRFRGYACAVSSLSDVSKAYKHLKIKHCDATHVILAYRLANVDPLDGEGWCDDGEHQAGSKLLKMLRNNNKTQTAVFVVRYYGGIHLQKRRFAIILELAEQALENLQKSPGGTSCLQLKQLQHKVRTVIKQPHPTAGRGGVTPHRRAASTQAIRGGGRPHTALHNFLQRQVPRTAAAMVTSNRFTPLAGGTSTAETTSQDTEYSTDDTQDEDWSDNNTEAWDKPLPPPP